MRGDHIYDVIIVGGGIAGVMTAIYLQKYKLKIALIEKKKFLYSGSTFNNYNGKWGITYAKNQEERAYLFQLINRLGQKKNIQALSRKLVEHSYQAFSDLQDLGFLFTKKNSAVCRVSPCYANRPLASIICSVAQVREVFEGKIKQKYVTIYENSPVNRVLVEDAHYSVCIEYPAASQIQSRYGVVIACGGDIGLWQPNIVADGLTGDSISLAGTLNLRLINEEYRQRVWDDVDGRENSAFHPKMFFDKSYQFVDYREQAIELPEDLFSFREIRSCHVPIANRQPDRVVDEFFMARIPENKPQYAIVVKERASGETIDRILPFYQVSTGGILIDENGQTSKKGIYAAGEAAAGMHGVDRVGGMMICSSVVFAKLIAEHIGSVAKRKVK